jgi:hypothetical protein
MDFTFELSKIYNVLPFEILKQDKDEVIMLLNYTAEKSESAPKQYTAQNSDKQYIKVNDKTATGGWW